MNQKITLYHGSEQLVETPTFGLGKKNNDFGLGFYCTESEELAKEWAVSSLRNGFANRYSLDTEYLKILNLNSPDYTILNWIAVLVEHRLFSIKTPAAQRAKRYLIDNFSVNVNAYDLIIGYRADDSYFDYPCTPTKTVHPPLASVPFLRVLLSYPGGDTHSHLPLEHRHCEPRKRQISRCRSRLLRNGNRNMLTSKHRGTAIIPN